MSVYLTQFYSSYIFSPEETSSKEHLKLNSFRNIIEFTSQCTHVQNHAYANKSRRTYVGDVRQLSNPDREAQCI